MRKRFDSGPGAVCSLSAQGRLPVRNRVVADRLLIGFVSSLVFVLFGSMFLPSSSAAQTITEIIDFTGDGTGNVLQWPVGVAADGSGNAYVVGGVSDNVFKITPGGAITELIDSTGDGIGNSLVAPLEVAVDSSGNVYVTGAGSNNVFKITPGGVITEIIDSAGDGMGSSLAGPRQVAVDASGNVYVTGGGSNNAFQIEPTGVITEIINEAGDGTGNILESPGGVAVDASGNVYVTGGGSNNAFQIEPTGVITEIIDSLGAGAGSGLNTPGHVAVDASGNVYVTGALSDNAFKITPGGVITEIIDSEGDRVDNLGSPNSLNNASNVAVDASSNVFVTGRDSFNVFRMTPTGGIRKIAGSIVKFPLGIAADASGNVYVSGSSTSNAIRITPPGPPVACPASPSPSCLEVAQGKLQYDEQTAGKEKMKMLWKGITTVTIRPDFGNPATAFTSAALCIYDDGNDLVRGFSVARAGEFCPHRLCWRAKGRTGFRYKDREISNEGVLKIDFRSGDAGKGRGGAKGKNNLAKGQTSLPLGVVTGLSGSVAPTIQMVTSNGFCVGATMNEVQKDDGLTYKARLK